MGTDLLRTRVERLHHLTGGARATGWMHDPVCWLLFGLIRYYRPSLVIQTGHLWGKSALVVLEALKNERLEGDGMADPAYARFVADHSPPRRKGKLVSIDPGPSDVPGFGEGVEQLREWYPRFRFYAGSSAKFFENERPEGERIFGIVDGDHTREGAKRDLDALARLEAGMIFLDDTSWIPHLGTLGAHFPGYTALEFPLYNGVMVLTRAL